MRAADIADGDPNPLGGNSARIVAQRADLLQEGREVGQEVAPLRPQLAEEPNHERDTHRIIAGQQLAGTNDVDFIEPGERGQ